MSEDEVENFIKEAEGQLESKLEEFNNSLSSLFEKLEKELDALNERLKSLPRRRESLAIALRELKSLRRKAYAEVKNLINTGRLEFRDLTWKIRRRAYDLSKGLDRENREELLERIGELIDEYSDRFDDMIDEWSDRLDYFTDMLSDLADKVKLYLRGELRFTPLVDTIAITSKAVNEAMKEFNEVLRMKMREVDEALRRLGETMGKLFGGEYGRKTWGSEPTLVVSSIRLPKKDIDLIDLLVEVGIFRSRSEGVSYFTHKGIEASREALEKLKSKLESIKKLQEEVKREAERMLKGEKEGGEEETHTS